MQMKDILLFKRMVTPFLIQILFWLAVLFCLLTAIVNFWHGSYRYALEALFLGPLLARVIAEVIILWFRIYAELRVRK